MPALLKVAALLLSAAVVGTFAGLVWGTAEVLQRQEPPSAVLTPAPVSSPTTASR